MPRSATHLRTPEMLKRAKESIKKRKRTHALWLKKYGGVLVKEVLEVFPDIPRGKLFSNKRDAHLVHVRSIAVAGLFHIVLRSRGRCDIATYTGLRGRAVWDAVLRVDKEIVSDSSSDFRRKIDTACRKFRIRPEHLLLHKR